MWNLGLQRFIGRGLLHFFHGYFGGLCSLLLAQKWTPKIKVYSTPRMWHHLPMVGGGIFLAYFHSVDRTYSLLLRFQSIGQDLANICNFWPKPGDYCTLKTHLLTVNLFLQLQ